MVGYQMQVVYGYALPARRGVFVRFSCAASSKGSDFSLNTMQNQTDCFKHKILNIKKNHSIYQNITKQGRKLLKKLWFSKRKRIRLLFN
jgi:hypothetical protein